MRPLDEIEQRIANNVEEHGCSIMSVFDPDGVQQEFSYSIGFERTTGQPEVIVFSLAKSLRVSMINEVRRQIGECGLKLADGIKISDLVEGHNCVAREITDRDAISEHFGSAIWYNQRFGSGEIERAFQIVWPGAQQGLFPWEDGCAPEVIEDQPVLYGLRTIH